MNGGFNTSGFTIIETLIVLGVTAALLFSVMLLIGGKTSQAQFTSAINGVKTNLQQIINLASDGSYPNEGKFQCSLSSNTITINSATSNQQGANYGCTFLGSLIRFGSFAQPTALNQQYEVYTIVGQQCISDTAFSSCEVPTSWTTTDPYILPASTKTTSTQSILSGLSLVSTTLIDSNSHSLGTSTIGFSPSIAFLVNPAQLASATTTSSTATTLSPGALQLSLFTYTSACDPASEQGSPLMSANCSITPIDEADLCFASATTDQSGLITIGGGGAQDTVSLKIFGGNNCA